MVEDNNTAIDSKHGRRLLEKGAVFFCALSLKSY